MNDQDVLVALEKEKQRLMDEIQDLESSDPTKDGFRDRSNTEDDDAGESEDFSRFLALTNAATDQLKLVERAIAKVHEGTYGKDDLNGQPIPAERLEAIPWAIYTVESEEKMERA